VRVKLDENLGRGAAVTFAVEGHDVSSVHLQGMDGAHDNRVFEVCREEQRVLVTLDLDFANPLTYDPRPTAGVAVLRLPKDHGPSELRTAIKRLLDGLAEHDILGSLWVVRESGVRVWKPRDDV
jgi:predicted nuclease of predicted toxin-antitoxin system